MKKNVLQLDECDPKPAKPIEYIAKKIGFETIGVDEFMTLKEDFNRLRDEVSIIRKELTKLNMQSIDDVQDIENNNMPIDQSTMNSHEQSMGLVFGDICFETFTNGDESYNVFAQVSGCSLANKNVTIVPTNNSDLVTCWPENQNNLIGMTSEIDSSAKETISNESSGIKVLQKFPEERTSATVSSNEIIPATPKTLAIDASHLTEVSAEVNSESDDQSITDISMDQSKTSASDCSHSTEVEKEDNVSECQSDGSTNETFNTDETSDIQGLEMIPEEHETDESTFTSSNETIPSEMLDETVPDQSVEVNKESDEQNTQSITDISLDQSKASASDCSHEANASAEISSLKGDRSNITTTHGLSDNTVISSDLSKIIIDNEILPIIKDAPDLSLVEESIEKREKTIETDCVDNNNISETTEDTEDVDELNRYCFIQTCNEMQAAKLPTSDSEDSEVKMSNTTQSDEMVARNIYQQLANDTLGKMTGSNNSDSAECFEMNTIVHTIQPDSALIIMDGVKIPDHDIEVIDSQIKMNIKSMNQDSSQRLISSSSSDSSTDSNAMTTVERSAQNELNEDCSGGISDHGAKATNGIDEVKHTQFLHDDIETEFLLSVSSAAQRSIRTFPSK